MSGFCVSLLKLPIVWLSFHKNKPTPRTIPTTGIALFWNAVPCSLIGSTNIGMLKKKAGGSLQMLVCTKLQGLTSQKIVILTFSVVRTLCLALLLEYSYLIL